MTNRQDPSGNIHRLKTHPHLFIQTLRGLKPFELRLNDRNYQVGDLLVLDEYIPDGYRFADHPDSFNVSFELPDDKLLPGYTGRYVGAVVHSLITHADGPWLQPGYVAMGIEIAFEEHGDE